MPSASTEGSAGLDKVAAKNKSAFDKKDYRAADGLFRGIEDDAKGPMTLFENDRRRGCFARSRSG